MVDRKNLCSIHHSHLAQVISGCIIADRHARQAVHQAGTPQPGHEPAPADAGHPGGDPILTKDSWEECDLGTGVEGHRESAGLEAAAKVVEGACMTHASG